MVLFFYGANNNTVNGKIRATLSATKNTRHTSGTYHSLIFMVKFPISNFFMKKKTKLKFGGHVSFKTAYRTKIAYHTDATFAGSQLINGPSERI